VLPSFLRKKIVSTKWRIEKGILVGPRLLWQGISRGCRECELFFQLKSLQKILYRDLKWKKKLCKEEKVSKNPFQWAFLRKAIVLNRIYAEIVV
jgi:hypothetical protein